VALKLVKIPEVNAASASLVLREGRMLARVRHPNVVTVFGATKAGNEVGLWMELVRGRSLAEVVRKDGPFGAEEASVIGLSVCRALAAVHAAGLVHRDIKAQNVMREAGGRIVLMDFGAGWDTAMPDPDGSRRAPGTPAYMAPEVISGHPATPLSDIYGVGVLLYYLVTGRHPVDGRSLADIAVGQRRLLEDDRPDLPERFIRIVERALAVNPSDRHQSAGALIRDLSQGVASDRSWQAGDPSLAVPWPPTDLTGHRTDSGTDPASVTPRLLTPQADVRAEPRSSWVRHTVIGVSGVLLLPCLLGFLTSMAFNVTLGRSAGFANESPLAWWVWGLRALLPHAIYLTAGVLALLLVRSVFRLARRVLAGLDRWCRRTSSAFAEWALRAGFADLTLVGQLLVLVQVALIVAFCYRFRELLSALTLFINDALAGSMALLEPSNAVTHVTYGRQLDAVILFTAAAWVAVVRQRRRQGLPAVDASAGAGIAGLAVCLLLLILPYRTMWQNEFERVQFDNNRCYVIGQRPNDLLVHCPDLPPPRNRVVSRSDERLRLLGVIENIFTPAADVKRR
jgi:hypothetical protein